nr:unnamed protein product [Callosobruchus chinensis]
MVVTREVRDEIKNCVASSVSAVLNDDAFINRVAEKVADNIAKTLVTRMNDLEKKIEDIISSNSTVVNDLKEETSMLRAENDQLQKKIDFLDQECRMNNLRIFNLPEKEHENLAEEVIHLVSSRLGMSIKQEEILDCRRLGRKRDGKPRGIILKLTTLTKKQNIYNKKKMLRGTNICIKEDLTESKLKLMEAAIEKTSLRSVWSYLGNVYVLKNNNKIVIRSQEDIAKI